MARNKIKVLLTICFAGLISFYYIIPQSLAYTIELTLLLLAFLKRPKIVNYLPFIWYVLFFTYILIDSLLRDDEMMYVSSCLNVTVFMLILCFLIDSKESAHIYIKSSAYFGVLLSLFIYIKYSSYLGVGRLGMELPGTRIDSAITLGYIFLYITCLQIYSIFKLCGKKYEIIVLVLGLLLSLYLTVLTGTRKAIYIPILYLLALLFLRNRKSFIRLVVCLILFSIIGLFSFRYMVNKEIINADSLVRIEGSLSLFSDKYDKDESTIEREVLIKQAAQLFYERPIIGVGVDRTIKLLTKHPHNNYLSTLSMGGLLMFLLYYWIYLYCFFSKRLNRKELMALFFIIAFVLPLSDLGTTSFNIVYFNVLIGIFILASTKKQGNRDNCIPVYRISHYDTVKLNNL